MLTQLTEVNAPRHEQSNHPAKLWQVGAASFGRTSCSMRLRKVMCFSSTILHLHQGESSRLNSLEGKSRHYLTKVEEVCHLLSSNPNLTHSAACFRSGRSGLPIESCKPASFVQAPVGPSRSHCTPFLGSLEHRSGSMTQKQTALSCLAGCVGWVHARTRGGKLKGSLSFLASTTSSVLSHFAWCGRTAQAHVQCRNAR